MLNFDENIDLDALFDSLNIGEAQPAVGVSKSALPQRSDVKTTDLQELSPLDGDLFIFDTPTDQS